MKEKVLFAITLAIFVLLGLLAFSDSAYALPAKGCACFPSRSEIAFPCQQFDEELIHSSRVRSACMSKDCLSTYIVLCDERGGPTGVYHSIVYCPVDCSDKDFF